MQYSALIGNPVEHSISPALFSLLAEYSDLEYAHLKIRVMAKGDLRSTLKKLQSLGFCGVNVTLPYKIDVIRYLDSIDLKARKIGAVNTIVFKNSRVIGYNTDAEGALRAIEVKLKKVNKKDRALVLGSGGAARAIVSALYTKTNNVVILSRDIQEAKILSLDISGGRIKFNNMDDNNINTYFEVNNIIINATPVGMSPSNNIEIINEDIFSKNKIKGKYFFDAIFNPYKTNFLINAEKRGGKVCPGMYMMIFQGIAAFKLWTGIQIKNIDIEKINKILISKIT